MNACIQCIDWEFSSYFPEVRDIICCTALFSSIKAEKVAKFIRQTYGDKYGGLNSKVITGDEVRSVFWLMFADQNSPCNAWRNINYVFDERVVDAMKPLLQFLTDVVWSSYIRKDNRNLNLPSWGRSLAQEEKAAEDRAWQNTLTGLPAR